MASQSTVTDSLDAPRRQRPAAVVRTAKGSEQGGVKAANVAPRPGSSRASSSQLMRACLIVFLGFLCVAYSQAGSARAAGQAVVCPIEAAL